MESRFIACRDTRGGYPPGTERRAIHVRLLRASQFLDAALHVALVAVDLLRERADMKLSMTQVGCPQSRIPRNKAHYRLW